MILRDVTASGVRILVIAVLPHYDIDLKINLVLDGVLRAAVTDVNDLMLRTTAFDNLFRILLLQRFPSMSWLTTPFFVALHATVVLIGCLAGFLIL